ncbi:hypothetical protein KEG38_44220 [Polyangium jinanense]|uniref:kelch repeat-containing protein n=1 Tax=Polyangium jinanense TaxID=2829994 RepID=UPI00234030C1|nr:kelch repeat-containing protein [Polyangium jinanense]MDC3960914.1 hypothetical protein [Polyangium jinanense]
MPSITTWTRLEPRARSGDMRPGLEARVHDPLWLLGRQWQVGEFQGEDAGSPVWARLRAEAAPLGAVRAPRGKARSYSAAMPLEVEIEHDAVGAVDRRTAAEAGLHFLRQLDLEGAGAYRDPFRQAFPLAMPAGEIDAASLRYLAVMRRRAPDGLSLAAALRSGLPAGIEIAPEDVARVQAAANRYLAWFDDLVRVAPAGETALHREQFEYHFEVAAQSAGATVVLKAANHQGGALDWHSFIHDTEAALPVTGTPTSVVATTLPVRASYAGMPAARFWELEDSRVDLGSIDAAPSDLARMLVLDFATIYGNDWYVIPLELNVGTLTHVRSLVVGDTFGDTWLIERGTAPDWAMYELTAVGLGAAAAGERLNRLFLPPALTTSLESEPLEDVVLLRDEDANVAWAIERTVEGAAGTRVNRVEAWHEQRRLQGDAASHAGSPVQIAPLVYRLASEVPEHWIPLVPEEAAPGTNVLRVAALERATEDGPPEPILPRGRLLDPGRELLVPEEEVPAEGVRLTRTWQYARWIDGSTHLWSAVRKRAGRGMASSGLVFDSAEPWQAPLLPLAHDVVALRMTSGASGVSSAEPVDLDLLLPGQAAVVRFHVHNIGLEGWQQAEPGALRLATANPPDHPGRLAAPSWLSASRPCGPVESTVGPGQVATLQFEIRVPAEPGPFEETYDLIVEGRGRVSGPGLRLRGHVMGWVQTARLSFDRLLHTAIRLRNGQVLVVGGYNPPAELYNPATNTWSSTANAPSSYRGATMVLLPSGKVLLAGAGSTGKSAVLYDPDTGTWSVTGNLATPRFYHTATLLQDGRVLVTGGTAQEHGGTALASAEIYNPIAGTWTAAGSLGTARQRHTATLLPSGMVLVAGGEANSTRLASAELYDPATGAWTTVSAMATARTAHTATQLRSGKVLVTGGGVDGVPATKAELYDPATGLWSPVAAMNQPRGRHTATLLPSGKVLVAGGYDDYTGIQRGAEVYDPARNTWSVLPSMVVARYWHTTTLLEDNRLLVVGGFGQVQWSAELFSPLP